MDTQKVAEYVVMVFNKTYGSPSDIEKAFRATIKKMILFLSEDSSDKEGLIRNRMQFAQEVWQQMDSVTLDIVRSRISGDKTLGGLGRNRDVTQKKEELYFKKITAELMKALINMNYGERKKQARAGKGSHNIKK